MTDAGRNENVPSEPNSSKPVAGSDAQQHSVKTKMAGDEVVDVSKLSKEEQMALYEKQLKEDDWGHQPC